MLTFVIAINLIALYIIIGAVMGVLMDDRDRLIVYCILWLPLLGYAVFAGVGVAIGDWIKDRRER